MEYEIKKKKIKNFIIRIYPDKSIKISVPLSATKKQIETFIENKKEWVNTTLQALSEKEKFNKENSIIILGKIREKKLIESEVNMIRLSERSIYIYYNAKEIKDNKKEIDKIIENWKLKELNTILKEYLEKYLKLLNTQISSYKIKKINSAWGIYHPRKNYITFNKLLFEKDVKCIEYVVLHELCHIFFPNHKKEFWNLVEKYMYDYKIYRKLLKQ